MSDAVWVGGSLWVACGLRGIIWHDRYTIALGLAIGLFYIFAEFNDLYYSWRGASLKQELVRVWLSWAGAMLGLLLFAYAAKTSAEYSRQVILSWLLIAPSVLSASRICLRLIIRRMRELGYNTRTVAIAGAGKLGMRLARTILSSPWTGMRLVGFYDDRKPMGSLPLRMEDVEVKGGIDDLTKQARNNKIDLVYISLPLRNEERIKDIISALADTTASVYVVPDFFTFELLHARWTTIGGIPAVSVFESPFHGTEDWIKRAEDIILSSLILPLIAVPMLLIAMGIKMTSHGPVIFKQRRYGLDGRQIKVWKFRTMSVCEDGQKISQAQKGDPRVTKFGAFLRRTSLDELPQFINVLQGRMSIVGPRPHAVAHNEEYRKQIHGYMLRHKVRPGITGLAQMNGWRGKTDTLEKMKKRVEYDIAYIQNWSLWLDLKIIVVTIFNGFRGKNAY